MKDEKVGEIELNEDAYNLLLKVAKRENKTPKEMLEYLIELSMLED